MHPDRTCRQADAPLTLRRLEPSSFPSTVRSIASFSPTVVSTTRPPPGRRHSWIASAYRLQTSRVMKGGSTTAMSKLCCSSLSIVPGASLKSKKR